MKISRITMLFTMVLGCSLLIWGAMGIIPPKAISQEVDVTAPSEEQSEAPLTSSVSVKNGRLIVEEKFHATKLNNDRDLYVYLPPSYDQNVKQQYPVMYVQDGKGAFYLSDWSKESLSMHTTADELINEGLIDELIIVGISNMGEQRASEYAHWDGVDYGMAVQGNGELYEDFVINDVMPFVESNYRVLEGRENTAIMGASLGGLVSYNIGMRNPERFSKVAMLSPYLGWGDELLLQKIVGGEYKEKREIKMWMDVGDRENELKDQMFRVGKAMLESGYKPIDELAISVVPDGTHSESSWAERIDDILLFYYGHTAENKDGYVVTFE